MRPKSMILLEPQINDSLKKNPESNKSKPPLSRSIPRKITKKAINKNRTSSTPRTIKKVTNESALLNCNELSQETKKDHH